ncbi:carboxymuconolactone decarboxylase family protein [Streptomyces sp. NPDC053427]|uniref:carboxymuconolactone decarboxylase family protein n=1 Tax=Streptomyces sp. NPDC053427 TaxID=3365701 RepID=UPI0037D2CF94
MSTTMPTTPATPFAFPDHTPHSAPAASRPAVEATAKRLGYLPAGVARLATSPQLLNGFLELSALFETTTLDPLAREVLIMTIATRNGCHLCVAMHTAKLTALTTPPDTEPLLSALRAQQPLPEPRLEAIRRFTLAVLDTAGDVDPAALQAFLTHGYTPRNALEVVLGIGAYTLSTLANRLTQAPVDAPLAPYAWHPTAEGAPAPTEDAVRHRIPGSAHP